MRPGELTALCWNDIDFHNEIIKIRRTRIYMLRLIDFLTIKMRERKELYF